MKNLFTGLLLYLLTASFDISETASLHILPEFLGCFFLMKGFRELQQESDFFRNNVPLVSTLFGLEIVYFILNLVGGYGFMTIIRMVLSLLLLGLYIWTTNRMCLGIFEMQRKKELPLDADILYNKWKGMTIAMLASFGTVFLAVLIPGTAFALLSIAVLIANIVFSIQFVVAMYRTRNRYEASQAADQ